jgi:hypothetical protein
MCEGRAFNRVFPALVELGRRHPHDRWVLITLTVRSSDERLKAVVQRFKCWFAKLRRLSAWKRCVRGGVGGFEITYHPDTGWHFHVHVLVLRAAWWAQEELAAAWQQATGGEGIIVDIRSLRQQGCGLEEGLAETLKYPFKPTNLWDWGPGQVTQFNELTRMKLSECYGALRGLAGVLDDGEDQLGREPEEELPDAGDPCPECGLPFARVKISRAELEMSFTIRRLRRKVWGRSVPGLGPAPPKSS